MNLKPEFSENNDRKLDEKSEKNENLEKEKIEVNTNIEEKQDALEVKKKCKETEYVGEIPKNENSEFLTVSGEISHFQDEKIYRMINSDAFKNWYHGPAHENGEPQAFYHGTGDYFEKFDWSKVGTSRGFLNLGAGLYLSFERRDANTYRELAQGRKPSDFRGENIDNLQSELELLEKLHKEKQSESDKEIDEKFIERNKLRSEEKLLLQYLEKELKIPEDYYLFDGGEYTIPHFEKFLPSNISFLNKIKNKLNPKYQDYLLKIQRGKVLEEQIKNIQSEIDSMQKKYKDGKDLFKKLQEEMQNNQESQYPKGVILTCFANINNTLDFNNTVSFEKISEINTFLEKEGFEVIDEYGQYSGEELYSKLCEIIQGKPLVHHLSLKDNETQVDSKPVTAFLVRNNIFDSYENTNQHGNWVARKGQKALIVCSPDDILIV